MRGGDWRTRHIAIVGSGFTGTMLALQLLREGNQKVTLIERSACFGRGVAYSADGDQLLNVRASRMSAFPEDAGHFAQWLAQQGLGAPSDFAPRRIYGDYLSGLLAEGLKLAGDRLDLVQSEALDVERQAGRWEVILAGKARISVDAAVLALGNSSPALPAPLASSNLTREQCRLDPWASDIAEGLGSEDTVLLLGTGLTMIDVALQLSDSAFDGEIVALSRRGLLPRAHAEAAPHPEGGRTLAGSPLSSMVRSVRRRSAEIGWHAAVDELRPFTQDMWNSASDVEKQRFLGHLRPWWDVHRHRVAPQLAERIELLRRAGQLKVIGGKIDAALASSEGVRLALRRRGAGQPVPLQVARIINCTGPSGDIGQASMPLLRNLQRKGMIRADRHRLGIEVDGDHRIIGLDGQPVSGLFAIGPIARGRLWEVTAVPDLRLEAAKLAQDLTNPADRGC